MKLPLVETLGWARRGFWAVMDQALFAGSNFLVSVLLARWLEPASYGSFSVAYAVFLLLGTLHTGLWTEPMLVYGSGRFKGAFHAYQRLLITYQWRFGALASVILLLAAVAFGALGQQEMARSFLGLSLAAPVILYLWLVRRGAYVLLEPRLAAYGGAFFLVSYLTLSLLLRQGGILNEFTAFLCMALAAFVASVVIRLQLGSGQNGTVDGQRVWRMHWDYGRWALLAGALSWIPGHIYYLVLPAFHGLEAAAQLKALMNLLMPILHFNSALAQLLVPGMVRARASGSLMRFAQASLVAFEGFALVYWLFLLGLGQHVMEWLYGDKYIHASAWLLWLGLLPMLNSGALVGSSMLRALEQPRAVAMVYAVMAGFSATVGVALVWMRGFEGAVAALLLVNGMASLTFWLVKGRG